MLYTGKGDQGYTDLLGGRVPKYAARPETFGTLDEASCAIGMARALATSPETKQLLVQVQRDLYLMMAELAFVPGIEQQKYRVTEDHVRRLEETIDRLGAMVPIGRHFVLPGDTLAGATLDFARTVVRRAERLVARLYHEGEVQNEQLLAYLNRLSSLLFVLARFEDHEAGVTPTPAKEP
ncbi:MAG: cob(I)yrinic acid a,c-diamide adenosyltransferase [Thermomicrobium sp.]|nr:cob(I)yrinic acid a,c-diamide adenosyltransferase [Thermomicrobium sp.]MDW7981846.1 cob(I)yrinic acid a,c-diamide adenosyltransferase [Thermomicrobium sp.]